MTESGEREREEWSLRTDGTSPGPFSPREGEEVVVGCSEEGPLGHGRPVGLGVRVAVTGKVVRGSEGRRSGRVTGSEVVRLVYFLPLNLHHPRVLPRRSELSPVPVPITEVSHVTSVGVNVRTSTKGLRQGAGCASELSTTILRVGVWVCVDVPGVSLTTQSKGVCIYIR